MIALKVKDQDVYFANKVKVAKSFFERLLGLMFKSDLGEYDGLLIKSCNSIHTFFMKFPIHVIFLNYDYKIISINHSINPWRMTKMHFGASQVLELDARKEWKGLESLREGDYLEEVCIN